MSTFKFTTADSVITIGVNAFRDTKITSLKLENNVETIGNYAFSSAKLSSVSISSNTSYKSYSFSSTVTINVRD